MELAKFPATPLPRYMMANLIQPVSFSMSLITRNWKPIVITRWNNLKYNILIYTYCIATFNYINKQKIMIEFKCLFS